MTYQGNIDPLVPLRDRIDRYSEAEISGFRADFLANGFVRIPQFLPSALHRAITQECEGISSTSGRNKHLKMKSTGDTPRRMRTVGQHILREKSLFIPRIYACEAVRGFLGAITGETVHRVPWPPEEYVLSNLFRDGDTHGWHWDDYSFAFVLYLKAPDVDQGGFLQLCGGGSWDKDNPKVNETLLSGAIHTHRCDAADAYLLNAQKYLHRVTPIARGGERLIVNMTWANEGDLAAEMTHETNDVLFAS
jgi:hypothetical protein